jgi:hypothetical protein
MRLDQRMAQWILTAQRFVDRHEKAPEVRGLIGGVLGGF